MAFFIVIGTDNDVKCVVDEVKNAHLQHNVITSGCLFEEDDRLCYKWDVFNENGDKTKEESKETVLLRDALTNQISQFKTLLPDDAIPNVFIVSQCFDEKQCKRLQMVCNELYEIGGAKLSGLLVDIILLGYDLSKPENVTIRPHWKLLETIRGLGEGSRFQTDILYVNNMDYMGAATNVDSHILSKFLCNWSKIVCSGGGNPKATVQSRVYSIGMSEHQYDFRDLNEFFKLSAEERLLERKLNNSPSSATKALIDTNYFKKIILGNPWIDGLCFIHSLWQKYCTAKWDPSKHVADNEYSISKQELKLASYLNLFLKLFISEEQRDIDALNEEIAQKEQEKSILAGNQTHLKEHNYEDETFDDENDSVALQIAQLDSEIEACKNRIQIHEKNIDNNTFHDADVFHEEFGTKQLITEEDEAAYESNKKTVERLISYVKSETGIRIMREAIERATVQDVLPDPFPASEVLNMGRVNRIEVPPEKIPVLPHSPHSPETTSDSDNHSKRFGFIFWLKRLFKRRKRPESETPTVSTDNQSSIPQLIAKETIQFLNDSLGKVVTAMRKADDVRQWWNLLCEIIDNDKKRLDECRLLMDGEKNILGGYVSGKEGYHPEKHNKSTSLIDMDRVRNFRDSDSYYKQMIDKFLDRWFDKDIEPDKRMTMPELIKHQVLDPLVGRFHTLKWDGSSPFVKEDITDEEMHEYIEHDLKQSKPFVEYVRIQESNIVSNLNMGFFSNNQNIPTNSSNFKNKYHISTESIGPGFLKDFVNSLCIVQVMDIPEYVDSLKDFKPRRDTILRRMRTDIRSEVTTIIGDANTVEEKARAIYDWICDNISYDTTKQIHDAETCYRSKRGVCQAYCELFCYMADAAGITAEIITGITKDADGKISDEKHSWIYVYTHEYDGMFIDPTWGAGSVIDGVKFIKNEDNSMWFDVSPYWMIFSHFPDLLYWAKLDITVSEEQFKNLPVVKITNETDGKDILFECLAKTKTE